MSPYNTELILCISYVIMTYAKKNNNTEQSRIEKKHKFTQWDILHVFSEIMDEIRS